MFFFEHCLSIVSIVSIEFALLPLEISSRADYRSSQCESCMYIEYMYLCRSTVAEEKKRVSTAKTFPSSFRLCIVSTSSSPGRHPLRHGCRNVRCKINELLQDSVSWLICPRLQFQLHLLRQGLPRRRCPPACPPAISFQEYLDRLLPVRLHNRRLYVNLNTYPPPGPPPVPSAPVIMPWSQSQSEHATTAVQPTRIPGRKALA